MLLKNARQQFQSELRRLPLTLGKLIGAILAVIGFPCAINVVTRKPDPAFGQIAPYLALGIAGVLLFVLSSKLTEKRFGKAPEPVLTGSEKKRISMMSWMVFGCLIALLALISVVMSR